MAQVAILHHRARFVFALALTAAVFADKWSNVHHAMLAAFVAGGVVTWATESFRPGAPLGPRK